MNLREAIAAAASRLEGSDALRDAQLLLLHTLDLPRTALFTEQGRALIGAERTEYEAAIARRARGEPIQYITGQQEFYGLMLKVSPAVLIPRPETELLVEAVLARLPADRRARLVDVGTGSGAIAIALAKHMPLAQFTAVDLSPAALAVAHQNANAHGLANRIRFLQSNLLETLPDEPPFDAIVSNPPYIPETDRESLHRQVRDYEPAMALFAGIDGLEVYRRLIPQAFAALQSGGLLAMEIGYGQREAIAVLLAQWSGVEFLTDLQGIPRVVLARRDAIE
jgi:release factor glutamine methyltransferase